MDYSSDVPWMWCSGAHSHILVYRESRVDSQHLIATPCSQACMVPIKIGHKHMIMIGTKQHMIWEPVHWLVNVSGRCKICWDGELSRHPESETARNQSRMCFWGLVMASPGVELENRVLHLELKYMTSSCIRPLLPWAVALAWVSNGWGGIPSGGDSVKVINFPK